MAQSNTLNPEPVRFWIVSIVIAALVYFTPVPPYAYRVGVPWPGYFRELINSDGGEYGGSNLGNAGGAWAEPTPWQGQPHSLTLTLPPLAVRLLKPS